jgi:hypothetical protein
MQYTPDHQCRRCGHTHEDAWQLVDPEGCWAASTVQCGCGHSWTILHTAPANLRLLRIWIARGCQPAEGPLAVVRRAPWHEYRLEGVCPAIISAAS